MNLRPPIVHYLNRSHKKAALRGRRSRPALKDQSQGPSLSREMAGRTALIRFETNYRIVGLDNDADVTVNSNPASYTRKQLKDIAFSDRIWVWGEVRRPFFIDGKFAGAPKSRIPGNRRRTWA